MHEDLIRVLELLKKGRQYASFFEWPDKSQKELGVVEELISSLNIGLHSLSIYKPDPPDCICENSSGGLVAVEVVEVVCQDSAKLNAQGKNVHRIWKSGELTSHIERLLTQKDGKNYHGGPYVDTIACLFTDEPMLTFAYAQAELEPVCFGPFLQLTSAFLLFSYDPASRSYPVLPLKFKS